MGHKGTDWEHKLKALLEERRWFVVRGGKGVDLVALPTWSARGTASEYGGVAVEVKSTQKPSSYYYPTDQLDQLAELHRLADSGVVTYLAVRHKAGERGHRWRLHRIEAGWTPGERRTFIRDKGDTLDEVFGGVPS